MYEDHKKKLRITTIVFWVLLSYVIAALLWWFFSLYTQNQTMYELRAGEIRQLPASDQPGALAAIDDLRRRNIAKYVGEGGTFLILILFGAVYLYRSVRSQFRTQEQQQNFVMAITHELKTPLSVARLNLETLQRHQLDEAKKAKMVQMTLQETLRLDNLINNILITSQLDGNSYQITKEDLNLSDLVRSVTAQFSGRYTERKTEINIDEDIDMAGDPLLLKLLVSNLLENANKYSPRQCPIRLTLSRKGNKIQLTIADQGEGISTIEKKNVFRKFYRIGNEYTRKAKGTGLGLYLCRKIVRDHKGEIHIEDNQPQGSIFVVNFPV